MLHSTTLLIETAMVAAPTTTTVKTSVKEVEITKPDGTKETKMLANRNKLLLGTLGSSLGTTATYIFQEASFNNTIAKYHDAQAFVQCMTDEELASALTAIGELEPATIEQPTELIKK